MERKAFVKNSRDGERQVGHHGSCGSSSPSLRAYQTALRFLPCFGHFCVIREHITLSSVLRKSPVISYFGLDGHFYRSIKGTELEVGQDVGNS